MNHPEPKLSPVVKKWWKELCNGNCVTFNAMLDKYPQWAGTGNMGVIAMYEKEMMKESPEMAELLDALEYFTKRVEEGSIKSKTTYTKYKEILNKYRPQK